MCPLLQPKGHGGEIDPAEHSIISGISHPVLRYLHLSAGTAWDEILRGAGRTAGRTDGRAWFVISGFSSPGRILSGDIHQHIFASMKNALILHTAQCNPVITGKNKVQAQHKWSLCDITVLWRRKIPQNYKVIYCLLFILCYTHLCLWNMDKLSLQELEKHWFWRLFFRFPASCKHKKKSLVRIQLGITEASPQWIMMKLYGQQNKKCKLWMSLKGISWWRHREKSMGLCLCPE